MKRILHSTLIAAASLTLTVACARKAPPASPQTVYQTQPLSGAATPAPPAQPAPTYVYEQKPIGSQPVLVTQEQAQTTINRFKEAYPKLGSPRLLIYVNRELVDTKSGMKLIRRDERIESSRGGTNAEPVVESVEKNSYRADGKPEPTLADKQTVRDVERLFGRPLRAAGATLVDQNVASQLIADRPLADFIGTTDTAQARKDREAIGKIADAVIEILISSKSMTVTAVSGDRNLTVPDIQATAINLKDSKILAQTASTDVTSRVPPSTLANFDVREIAEATALALMDDLSSEAK